MIAPHIVERWQQALRNDRLIEWRSFGFLLAAEAKMSEVEWQFADAEEYKTLFETAMQHVYRLQPQRQTIGEK
jgi:hypothetical protein